MIEGYGMTETSCVISIMDEGDTLSGHVGSPSSACGELLTQCVCIRNHGNKISLVTTY